MPAWTGFAKLEWSGFSEAMALSRILDSALELPYLAGNPRPIS